MNYVILKRKLVGKKKHDEADMRYGVDTKQYFIQFVTECDCHDNQKQVTRGHNVVTDGWAGASNPHPHLNPPPTRKLTQKVSKTLIFLLINLMNMTDQRMDGRTKSCVSAAKKFIQSFTLS